MSKKLLLTIACALIAVLYVIPAYCQQSDETVVSIDVPSREALNVTVSRVTPGAGAGGTDLWSPASYINFGTLSYSTTNSIFYSPDYYALDIGVDNNADTWTLTHTINSITGREASNAGQNLDGNLNVTFVKQISDTSALQLSKVTFANSNGFNRTKAQLAGGWLRVYYGTANGDLNDAPGASPITSTKPSGLYQGSVILTLTSN